MTETTDDGVVPAATVPLPQDARYPPRRRERLLQAFSRTLADVCARAGVPEVVARDIVDEAAAAGRRSQETVPADTPDRLLDGALALQMTKAGFAAVVDRQHPAARPHLGTAFWDVAATVATGLPRDLTEELDRRVPPPALLRPYAGGATGSSGASSPADRLGRGIPRWLWWLWWVALALLGLVLLLRFLLTPLGGAGWAEPSPAPGGPFPVGTCVAGDGTVVPCSSTGALEVYFVGESQHTTWPGQGAAFVEAHEVCGAELTAVGSPGAWYVSQAPRAEDWAAGDRTIVCLR